MNAKLEALHEVRDELLWIKNSGNVHNLEMDLYHTCETVHCIAGWYAFRHLDDKSADGAERWAHHVCRLFAVKKDMSGVAGFVFEVLFGGENGSGLAAWEKQMRRVRFLIRREERRIEFEKIPDMSRKERRAAYERLAA